MTLTSKIKDLLILPEYKNSFDLDDPSTTEMRKNIILRKKFLKRLYEEWYSIIIKEMKTSPKGKSVEIGSGAGFLKTLVPDIITSDVMPLSTCDMAFSAEDMPFAEGELSNIVMVDVLHHIPKPYLFLKEAERCLQSGGKIIMIEPANSTWGRFIYKNFHHEPFNPDGDWEIPATGPLSGANGALPWIIFSRDRKKFLKEFPNLEIVLIKHHTGFRYLLSGGVSLKSLVPDFAFTPLKMIENTLTTFSPFFSMFQTIVIRKK